MRVKLSSIKVPVEGPWWTNAVINMLLCGLFYSEAYCPHWKLWDLLRMNTDHKTFEGPSNSFWELASVQITWHEELQNLKIRETESTSQHFTSRQGKLTLVLMLIMLKNKQQHLEVMCDNSHSYCFRFSEQSWSMQTFFLTRSKNLASHLNTYSVFSLESPPSSQLWI